MDEREEWFKRTSYLSDDFPTIIDKDRQIEKDRKIEEWYQSDLVDLVGYNLD